MDNNDSQRILIGVDGSSSSVAALRYAARLAEALDAPLEAVIVWAYPPYWEQGLVAGWSPEAEARSVLNDAIREAFGTHLPENLARSVHAGSPAHSLIKLSESYEMLVLGSRGHGGFAGLLLGSVSSACAAHAHCPVLIVHDSPARHEDAAGPAAA
jgi:nucleotide-binding universal stress UspA family protein